MRTIVTSVKPDKVTHQKTLYEDQGGYLLKEYEILVIGLFCGKDIGGEREGLKASKCGNTEGKGKYKDLCLVTTVYPDSFFISSPISLSL